MKVESVVLRAKKNSFQLIGAAILAPLFDEGNSIFDHKMTLFDGYCLLTLLKTFQDFNPKKFRSE